MAIGVSTSRSFASRYCPPTALQHALCLGMTCCSQRQRDGVATKTALLLKIIDCVAFKKGLADLKIIENLGLFPEWYDVIASFFEDKSRMTSDDRFFGTTLDFRFFK